MNFSLKQDRNSGMLFQNINKIRKSTPETSFHCTLRGTGKAIKAGWMLVSRISASQVCKLSSHGSDQQGRKPWIGIQLLHLVFPTDMHPITFAYCHLSAFLLRRTRGSGHTGFAAHMSPIAKVQVRGNKPQVAAELTYPRHRISPIHSPASPARQ